MAVKKANAKATEVEVKAGVDVEVPATETEVEVEETTVEVTEEVAEVEVEEPVADVEVDTKSAEVDTDSRPSGKVKIRMRDDHKCCIAMERYDLKAGKTYTVPENVKRILNKAGLLAPL